VAFFPQLVAGPISRAESLMPQLGAERPPPNGREVATGVALILRGLVRKVVIADPLADVVARGFDDPGTAGWVTAGAAAVAFAIQIYGDFAGYTDIARGSGRLFGIELVRNFRQPYLSRSVTEFWRRWHLSLSAWLRDYLYVPLGGNRSGPRRTAVNLGLTMVLGGLWHGAAWTFLAWGGLHGAYLVVERRVGIGRSRPGDPTSFPTEVATPTVVTNDRGEVSVDLASPAGPAAVGSRRLGPRARVVAAVVATFVAVDLAWVLFRAASLGDAAEVYGALATLRPGPIHAGDLALLVVLGAASLAIDLAERASTPALALASRHPALAGAAVGASLVGLVLFSGAESTPFIYFQF
jgi:D-alanyl-lipoteichoic acid acyltransferase DltB (MBOAT superfamily)